MAAAGLSKAVHHEITALGLILAQGQGGPVCESHIPELERQVSPFAISKNRSEEPSDGLPDFDESRMEQAMMALAGEMEGVDEDDPRAMARFMRKFTDMTGVDLGDGAEEAISRLEAGEDPEKIEEELGDVFDDDNMFGKKNIKGLKKKYLPPEHDDTLYTLD